MRISTVREGVAKALEKENMNNNEIIEFFVKKENQIIRILYVIADGSTQVDGIILKIEATFKRDGYVSEYKKFSNVVDLCSAIIPDQNDRTYYNWRGRILKLSQLNSRNDEDFANELLITYWTITVSKHEEEYFSMIRVYPSFYHPFQQAAGDKSLENSISAPLSFLEGLIERGDKIDEKWDRLKIGIEEDKKPIDYFFEEPIVKKQWGGEELEKKKKIICDEIVKKFP